MSTYDLSFTIREIRTAHLAFPTPPVIGNNTAAKTKLVRRRRLRRATNSNPVGRPSTPPWSRHRWFASNS